MTTVTVPLEELARLVEHKALRAWVDLPRVENGRYHRCLQVTVQGGGEDPEIRMEVQVNASITASVTHRLSALFNVLPRLHAFLTREGL